MRIALFVTCFNDTMGPETGKAVVTVLERLGHTVEFPLAQTCCGQMHFNTGYRPEAMPLMRRFVEAFAGYDAIVTPSASCAGMVRENHPALAGQSGDEALRRDVGELAPRVPEFTEFLVDVLGVTGVGAYFPHRVTYHPTCHSLRGLRLGDKPQRLRLPRPDRRDPDSAARRRRARLHVALRLHTLRRLLRRLPRQNQHPRGAHPSAGQGRRGQAHQAPTPTAEALAMRAATAVLSSPGRIAQAQKAAALGGRLVARKGVIGPLPGPLRGWTDVRDTPAPPPEPFRAWWQRTHPQPPSGDQ
ncbi:heterodisulfide reductase-related iron-sulfur binding cluster [Streptacidiphilus rugosus]|uniref:heterodisulfide reductase-related iron-sulfur binding cluster n=1 Tax=Streptacidiphilus rugosus TaxID=405783 RepID=UPI000A01EB07|nr:heterodisulfide reductase-related iron-sulfur binding cluster [Streptacidiphilus rugosus]